MDVSISVQGCDDYDEDSYVEFNIYIDPSRVAQDQNGNPIAGATVTLLRDNPDTVIRDFEAVADGSVLMDPAVNNTNPDTTDAQPMRRWLSATWPADTGPSKRRSPNSMSRSGISAPGRTRHC